MSSSTPSSGAAEGKSDEGVESKATAALNTDSATMTDPFASQRNDDAAVQNGDVKASPTAGSPVDRRFSADEWDASKTSPSQFQKRKGSVLATPGSRDSHVDRHKERDQKFHDVADNMKSGLFGRRRKSTKSSEADKKDGEGEK